MPGTRSNFNLWRALLSTIPGRKLFGGCCNPPRRTRVNRPIKGNDTLLPCIKRCPFFFSFFPQYRVNNHIMGSHLEFENQDRLKTQQNSICKARISAK